jgi:hypothetical protein
VAQPPARQPIGDAPTPTPTWLTWIAGLPAWATLSAAAVCCITVVLILGAVLLVGLRMIGVDKQS